MEELKKQKRKGHIKSKTIKRVLSCPVELALQRWVLCICGVVHLSAQSSQQAIRPPPTAGTLHLF